MRFSINIPNFGDFADARTVARVAAAAEQAGWDTLFGWDHMVHDNRQRRGQPFGDPWMLSPRWPGDGRNSSPDRWPPWTPSAAGG
jgi:alkanesulfonate monooxygenase SsuD/methylene tetrahydromethanopterin reductase-like flavin-dependent oxidoreductase (luciferase family)